jgi:hypothetical protein
MTHSKPPTHPSVSKERTGENGEYVTPAVAHTTLVRVQPTISPEDAIQRLISSKTAYSSSPHTELALKKGVKRMRAVTSSEISSVVCGVANSRFAPPVHKPLPPSLPAAVAVTTVPTSAVSAVVTKNDVEAVLDGKKNRILPYSAAPTIPHIVESTVIHVRNIGETLLFSLTPSLSHSLPIYLSSSYSFSFSLSFSRTLFR